jgi:3-methyladenine DNA glycosylase/8-oxoguanine DNA glycosylase
VVRQRSAKPSFAGSIPAVASSISLPENFSFEATVTSHGWYRLAPFRWDGRVLRRREVIGDKTVEMAMSVRRGKLLIEGAPLTDELRARITRMFQLDVDTSEFHELARHSPRHAWVADEKFGRLLCGATLWEDAVKIVATTNTMWRQTIRMVELLVEKCGRDGAFPSQQDVLRFSADELQRDCRLGYRAKSIHSLASRDLSSVPETETTQDRYRFYLTLPGIGPYGAAHLLAMDGRHDFIAVDTEFRRYVRDTYHRGRKVSDAAMLRHYSKWGRWKYLAYWSELWSEVAASLQPPKSAGK